MKPSSCKLLFTKSHFTGRIDKEMEIYMYYIIVNPASKTGKGQKIWNKLQTELEHKKVTYQVYFTKGVTDGTTYAKQITQNITSPITLIILGGDGTVNEVIQGIENKPMVRIGYIPTGSSNDLARDLGLSHNPLILLEHILTHTATTSLDIGKVTYLSGSERLTNRKIDEQTSFSRLFAVGCGIGFDAAVCEEALRSPIKNFFNHLKLGKLTYLGIALKQILKAPKVSCDLYLDNTEKISYSKFLFIVSMVHRFEGGGFMFCPNADATDGLFDICIAGNISSLQALRILPHAFKGNHLRYPQVFSYRAKNVHIKTSIPLWVQTDGEVHMLADEIHLTNVESKLQFIY